MTVTITYDGDPADLILRRGAAVEIRNRATGAGVHGFRWDENLSRLTFDAGSATELELILRPAARWPRYRRRPTFPGPDIPATPTPPVDTPEVSIFSDGGATSVGGVYSDGTTA